MPGTTCNGASTNSAINNTQASSYIRAPEGVARRYNGIKCQDQSRPGTMAVVPGGIAVDRYGGSTETPLAGVTTHR